MFITFLSIVFIIYSSINYYIFRHFYPLFSSSLLAKKLYIISFTIIASSYFIYRICDKIHSTPLVKILGQIGSIWLVFMVYALLTIILYDIAYWLCRLISPTLFNYLASFPHIKTITSSVIITFISVITIYAFFNAGNQKIVRIDIKPLHANKTNLSKPYKIAYASDLHINDLFYTNSVKKLVDQVNEEDVDLMLFGGDVFTEDVSHLSYHDSGEVLKKLKTRYGVYTVFGNHEYIGSIESAINHFEKYNIKILQDSSVLINNELVVIGRDDLSAERMLKKKRASLQELLINDVDSLFTIVVDHQPRSYQEGKDYPIDLYLSGHTHHGQLYPFSLITKKIFNNSWGLQILGKSYYYVSCGYGFWGPVGRVGSKPEMIIFTIE